MLGQTAQGTWSVSSDNLCAEFMRLVGTTAGEQEMFPFQVSNARNQN
jgi:hypothetical protein